MLINKDNLSIQQKYSFIEDVKLNKSGNVSESPPSGYGDCATHQYTLMELKKIGNVTVKNYLNESLLSLLCFVIYAQGSFEKGLM